MEEKSSYKLRVVSWHETRTVFLGVISTTLRFDKRSSGESSLSDCGEASMLGRMDDAVCSRCGEEAETPDHIVLRCRKIKRMKDSEGKGRREWVRENRMK